MPKLTEICGVCSVIALAVAIPSVLVASGLLFIAGILKCLSI